MDGIATHYSYSILNVLLTLKTTIIMHTIILTPKSNLILKALEQMSNSLHVTESQLLDIMADHSVEMSEDNLSKLIDYLTRYYRIVPMESHDERKWTLRPLEVSEQLEVYKKELEKKLGTQFQHVWQQAVIASSRRSYKSLKYIPTLMLHLEKFADQVRVDL